MQTLQRMLRPDLTLQIIKSKDQFPQRKNKKVIELMKVKLRGRIMKEFVALRPEIYSYLTDKGYVDKKAKSTRKSRQNIKLNLKTRKMMKKC